MLRLGRGRFDGFDWRIPMQSRTATQSEDEALLYQSQEKEVRPNTFFCFLFIFILF
jgi:hypothetical protein